MAAAVAPVGSLLREWRQRRRLSQLGLACEAEISTRHLSFLETGRSTPSREMLLRLADRLDVPLRERNTLLIAAGYAPLYSEKPISDPALGAARRAINMMLEAQKPYPAFALDKHWSILESNNAIPEAYDGVAPFLLEPPINALRLALHPQGLAPRVANLAEWRAHLLARLDKQIQARSDAALVELRREFASYPDGGSAAFPAANLDCEVAVPFRIHTNLGLLSFFSMTTVFGTALDVTLSEVALEFFAPADPFTAETVREAAANTHEHNSN
jgi:transcriptional regulator with XRE-family HTH domain